nr:hypothetical protein [Oecophyllibacter saccharovorans]
MTARLVEVSAETNQLRATVKLIRAMGGGWTDQDMPKVKQIDPIGPLQYTGLQHPRPVQDVPTETRAVAAASADLDGNWLTAPALGSSGAQPRSGLMGDSRTAPAPGSAKD